MDKLKQTIILFDLDGTLTDSMEGVIRSAQYMQEKMGMKVWSFDDLRFMVGPPLIESFTKEFGMELKKAEEGIEVFRERYSTIGLFENKVFHGIVEMLEELQAKGKRMAVATSKKEDLAVRILEHFEIAKYFEVIGGDMREAGRDNKAKVIEYVLETMKEALNSNGYEVSMNILAQGCRYALEEYTGYKPAGSNVGKPELPQEVYNAVSQFTVRMYDGLMKYCLELGLSKETAKAFLDGYFDFYLHYYMAKSEEAVKGLVASQTTKGGVAEKGEQIYKAKMQDKLREVFSHICSKEPDTEFYDRVEDYVINCSRQVLAHGANMGKKKS